MTAKKRELTKIERVECSELKRLFLERKADLKITQASAAEFIGVTQSAVNHYLNGINALNAPIASQFAKLLNIPVTDFSHRLAADIDSMSASVDALRLKSLQPKKLEDTTVLHLYDVAASCGSGVLNSDYPELLRTLEIPNSAIMELLGTNNLKNMDLMSPDGDSMEPTIPRKSITLIKTNINYFDNSGVYLITFEGFTYIKRLARGKHGVIKVMSDNKKYTSTDFEISPDEMGQLVIHGKFWKALPLEFLDI